MKKRFICFLLVFCFLFTSLTPRKTYGFVVAAPTLINIAIALISACGITWAVSDSGLIEDTVQKFLDDNPEQALFLESLRNDLLNPDTGKIVIAYSLFVTYKDKVLDFIYSIYNYFTADTGVGSGSGSIVIPSDFSLNISTSDVENATNFTIGTSDNPIYSNFFINTKYYAGKYQASYYFLNYSPDDSLYYLGACTYTYENGIYNRPYYKPYYLKLNDFNGGLSFYRTSGFSDTYYSYNTSTGSESYLLLPSYTNNIYNDMYFDGYTYIMSNDTIEILNPMNPAYFIDVFPYDYEGSSVDSSYSYIYPENVTSEDVITGWTNALEGENDIIISPVSPDELIGSNGYDVAYGMEGVVGAVEGVDLPQGAVDTDVPDTGIIGGILEKIWDWILNFFEKLADLLKYLFIPSEGYFADNFNNIKNNFSVKFGFDNFDDMFIELQSIRARKPDFGGYINIDMWDKHIPQLQTFIKGFFYALMAIFNIKMALWLIRGTHPINSNGGDKS